MSAPLHMYDLHAPVLLSPAPARLTPEEVAGWTTLQHITLSEPPVCTEPDLFFHARNGRGISASSSGLRIIGAGTVRLDAVYNVLPLGALRQGCRIGRLALALHGAGRFEVTVHQSFANRSAERILTELVALEPGRETVIELDAAHLMLRDGLLWLELRNLGLSMEESVLYGGRFLTDAAAQPGFRLAICRLAFGPDDRMAEVLSAWTTAQSGRAALLSVTVDPDRAEAHDAALSALLARAGEEGFSHALVLDGDSLVGPEFLDRAAAALSLLRDGRVAFGAARVEAADAAILTDLGLTDTGRGLGPVAGLTNLRQLDGLLAAAEAAQAAADDGRLVPHAAALGFALTALQGLDCPVTVDRSGFEPVLRIGGDRLRLLPLAHLILRRDHRSNPSKGLTALQNLIMPEKGLCTEQRLYFNHHGNVAHDDVTDAIVIEQGAKAFFDTFFNSLSIGKWHANCALEGLWLGLRGRGKVEVKVFHAIPDRSWECLATRVATLSPKSDLLIDLSHYAEIATDGVIFFEILALSSQASLSAARYLTAARPDLDRRLMLSITTFRREAQVEQTARRLARFLDGCDFSSQIECLIVDNGHTANILPHPRIRMIQNANLGGAGGFTRGLIEGEARGFSHVLFMDDDAAIPMEALHRTYAFLSLARDPRAAVSGAMITTSARWRMAENGAVFDRRCRPLHSGTDLRERNAVFGMEFKSARARPDKMYAGWWYFAFPVSQVKHYPFPFFVRGDDVNFSLSNDFQITTLNGVVTFGEDFTEKETPLNWYLDLRSHMVHHLTLDRMEIGALGLVKIAANFFKRNLLKFQYESIDAVLMAWEDVLKGPGFFAEGADAAGPRAAVKALVRQEAWTSLDGHEPAQRPGLLERFPALRRKLLKPLLNGHLLPLYRLLGAHRVIPAWERGGTMAFWGASRLTFLNIAGDKYYVTEMSTRRGLKALGRFVRLALRTVIGYRALRQSYHQGHETITRRSWWQPKLGLEPDRQP